MKQTIVSRMYNSIQELVPILQGAPHQRHDCQEVAKHLDSAVKPLIEEILKGGAPLTDPFKDFLRDLEPKVVRLKKLGQSLEDQSWVVKHVFTSSTLVGQLRDSIREVRNCLTSLSSVQARIARELRVEIELLRRDPRQVDQSLAIGEGKIVSRLKELLFDLVSKSQTVPILLTECKLLADLLTALDNKADAAAVRELGGIPILVRLLEEKTKESATLAARTLEKVIRLDSESSALLAKTGGIRVLCRMLHSCESSTSFDSVEVLQLLALGSEEQSNKGEIVRGGGVPLLIAISSRGTVAVQELALITLLNVSRAIRGPDCEELFISALKTKEVGKCLLDIVQNIRGEDLTNEKNVVMAVSIIRNISLSGKPARDELMQEGHGAIRVLLDRVRHHDAVVSADIVRASVVALERFMTMPEGRVALINDGGVEAITDVLRLPVDNPQMKGFAVKILVLLIEDPQVSRSRDVCNRILAAGTVNHLNGLLECEDNGRTSFTREGQEQACLLLQHLLHKGPSKSDVCAAIRDGGCIPKLLELNSHGGQPKANALLEELRRNDRQTRRQINTFRASRP